MNQKWLNTMRVFDEYEKRFAKARADRALSSPWIPKDREEILKKVKEMLRYREDLVPVVKNPVEISRKDFPTYSAIQYRFETWDHFYSAATLFLPHKEGPLPLTFVCCGHGEKGRRSSGYMAMGARLAELGIAAMVPDNIGQGDRNRSEEFKSPSHWNSVAPFYCGLTLQGMIVMETVALIRYMAKDPRFDSARFAACGNSGGGTLTLFLAALAPELSVLASSGYPAEFAYVLSKERQHCACNLLRGCAIGPEMWEIYSLFAPKPLFLSQGKYDNLLPMDLAHRNARKVGNTYLQMSAKENFAFALTDTKHPWDTEDLNRISAFLSQKLLGVTPKDREDYTNSVDPDAFHVPMPKDAIDTDELAQRLTGKKMPNGTHLTQIFPPRYQGELLAEDWLETDVGRGDVMRIFAQMECALTVNNETKQ